jgi:hypothetical protein
VCLGILSWFSTSFAKANNFLGVLNPFMKSHELTPFSSELWGYHSGVRRIQVFGNVAPCRSVNGYWPFGEDGSLHIQDPSVPGKDHLIPDDGGSKLHRNASNYLPVDLASCWRDLNLHGFVIFSHFRQIYLLVEDLLQHFRSLLYTTSLRDRHVTIEFRKLKVRILDGLALYPEDRSPFFLGF